MGRDVENIAEEFPSKFFKAADFAKGERKRLTITGCTMEPLPEGTEKPALHFREDEHMLMLNKTNSNTIAETWGYHPKKWKGEAVELYVARVQFRDKMVDAIRLDCMTGLEDDEEEAPPKKAAPPQKRGSMKDKLPAYDEREPPPWDDKVDF